MNLEFAPAKKIFFFLLVIDQSILFLFPSHAVCKREHVLHFPNTAYELNIYKIYGNRAGKP